MESGIDKKLDILLISSASPNSNSPRMTIDMVESLKLGGHQVDLLLKYPAAGSAANVISVYSKYDEFRHGVYNRFKTKATAIKRKLGLTPPKGPARKYLFYTTDENRPPVEPSLVLKKITNKYDLVLVFFWQEMLTSKSIFEIYNKLKVPVLIIAADMFPMTGGCSYFWDCRNFEKSCGKCPAISSNDEHDFTNKIFLYKKQVYNNIDCVFLGNTWMNKFAVASGLFKNIDTISPVINENLFKPENKEELKKQLNLEGKIVLLAGSAFANDERKGFKYLTESLRLLSDAVADAMKAKIVIVLAGGVQSDLQSEFSFEILQVGHLSFEMLAKYYAMSDIYLSPTIQDAGPMMVNQALMCGTPVVAFEIGAAIDLVTKQTGHLAKYKDAADFCNGIKQLLELSEGEKQTMYARCREKGLSVSSYKAFRDRIYDIYKRLLPKVSAA